MPVTRLCLWLFFYLFMLPACQSPGDRLRRLQREFVEKRPKPEAFDLIDGTDTLFLPLPPSEQHHALVRQVVLDFRTRLTSLETAPLAAEERTAWRYFQTALDSLAAVPVSAAARPTEYSLDELLLHFIGRTGKTPNPGLLTRLVEAIPDYYGEVTVRWLVPPPKDAEAAVQRSLRVLEQFDQLEEKLPAYSIGYRERLQRALPAARRAVKDFIGLCRSSFLEG